VRLLPVPDPRSVYSRLANANLLAGEQRAQDGKPTSGVPGVNTAAFVFEFADVAFLDVFCRRSSCKSFSFHPRALLPAGELLRL
jgi:hypothetical protein